jgi:hypothetical protein
MIWNCTKAIASLLSRWRTAGLTIVLAVVHQIIGVIIGFELFLLAGGIQDSGGGWTRYGGIDWAWTNLAWLPGGLLLAGAGSIIPEVSWLARSGFILVLLGSGVAAYAFAVLFAPRTDAQWCRSGRCGWKVWVALLLWLAWIPVPVKMAWIYWHTVAY